MRRLIERIEALADRPNPVGDRVFEAGPVSGAADPTIPQGLNAEQRRSAASSLGRDLICIEGPPGMGKSYTNPRHRQKVTRDHLHLPKIKMREIIPKDDLQKLDKRFGTGPFRKRSASDDQLELDFGPKL